MTEKLALPRVTIVCIACSKIGESVAALYRCLNQVTPYKTILFTDTPPILSEDIEIIKIDKLNWKEYNTFVVKKLYKYIETEFVLIVQWDGYILDATQWTDEFYNYDYVGAKWLYSDGRNVGNGGFSLRSYKLHHALATDENIEITYPEDEIICRLYRHYLENKYNVKYAPEDIADKFAFELNPPISKTFGFHGLHHKPYVDTIVIKRTMAMGDVIMVEPVLHYFWKKGYRVALDTANPFYQLFAQQYFPIYPKEALPQGTRYTEYNLDMAYESKPKQKHLKSYYDFCGITDGDMRNPILRYPRNGSKLFKKYVIIHNDIRSEASRNIYGIDWTKLAAYFKEKGYTVIQLGAGEHEPIEGAIEMQTVTENLLMYVVAGADLFIGIDSGIAHISSAFKIPSIIFFGNVDPEIIYPDLTNKLCINRHDEGICDSPYCWHNSITQTGTPCYLVENGNCKLPPCVMFDTNTVLAKIHDFLKIIAI